MHLNGSGATIRFMSWDTSEGRTTMNAGYPDGCTQALHDAHFDPLPVDVNAVQAVIEERAAIEIRTGAPAWLSYVADYADSADLQLYVSLHMRGDPNGAIPQLRERLADDYRQHRIQRAQDGDEWDEVARDILEEAQS